MIGIDLLQVIDRWKYNKGIGLEGGDEYVCDSEIRLCKELNINYENIQDKKYIMR